MSFFYQNLFRKKRATIVQRRISLLFLLQILLKKDLYNCHHRRINKDMHRRVFNEEMNRL